MAQLELAELLPKMVGEPDEESVPLASLPADKELVAETPDRAMVETVRSFGVVEPIILLRVGKTTRVADGRRRILAARAAGLDEIPARVYDLNAVAGSLLTIILNDRRKSNPVAEYDAICELQQMGASEHVIFQATGMTVGTIRNRVKLGDLHEDLMALLRQGSVAIGVAQSAARLPRRLQELLILRFKEGGKLTTKDVKAVKTARTKEAAAALPDELFEEQEPATWRDIAAMKLDETLAICGDSVRGHEVRRLIEEALEVVRSED